MATNTARPSAHVPEPAGQPTRPGGSFIGRPVLRRAVRSLGVAVHRKGLPWEKLFHGHSPREEALREEHSGRVGLEAVFDAPGTVMGRPGVADRDGAPRRSGSGRDRRAVSTTPAVCVRGRGLPRPNRAEQPALVSAAGGSPRSETAPPTAQRGAGLSPAGGGAIEGTGPSQLPCGEHRVAASPAAMEAAADPRGQEWRPCPRVGEDGAPHPPPRRPRRAVAPLAPPRVRHQPSRPRRRRRLPPRPDVPEPAALASRHGRKRSTHVIHGPRVDRSVERRTAPGAAQPHPTRHQPATAPTPGHTRP